MKVLAIETATSVCGAAVIEQGRVLAERQMIVPHMHSEKLLSFIDEALNDAKTRIEDVDCIAVSIGPGSFTGLRIGLSSAKGLAYGLSKPIVPVSTLEALAWNGVHRHFVHEGDIVLPMIDARRAEMYAAVFRYSRGTMEEIIPVQAAHLADVNGWIVTGQRTIILGDGVEKFYQYIMKSNSSTMNSIVVLPPDLRQCTASSVGLVGEQKFLRRETADVATLEPVYVKDFHTLVKTQHSA